VLRDEGEFQSVCAQDTGEARRGCRCRVRRRTQARTGGGNSGKQDRVFGRRQDRSRTSSGFIRGHSLHQRRVRTRTQSAIETRGRDRTNCADFGSRQSGHRFRKSRENFDRQIRKQIRHSDCACARCLCARRQAAGRQDHRRRYAYRQPDHRSRAARGRVPRACGLRDHAACGRPYHFARRFAASAFPITPTARRRLRRSLTQTWSSA